MNYLKLHTRKEKSPSELHVAEVGARVLRQGGAHQQRADGHDGLVALAQLAHLVAQLVQHGVVGLVVARRVLQQRDLLLLQLLLLAALDGARAVQAQQRAPRAHVRVQRLPRTS